MLYAPNAGLVEMLRKSTGKPVFLMKRGIDTELFHPSRRTVNDGVLRLGYAGRITPEKSVRFLKELETGLKNAGAPPFRFLVIGEGSERDWLRRNLADADTPGIHRGEELARDYANMDVFAFPSRIDTFGNVVLEALASGVPATVTDAGGPRFIVNDGVSGLVAGHSRCIHTSARRGCREMRRCGRGWRGRHASRRATNRGTKFSSRFTTAATRSWKRAATKGSR